MANFELNDSFVQGAEERAKSHTSKRTDHQVMLNARVPKKLRDNLKFASLQHDRSSASIVEEALEDWLKKEEKHNEKEQGNAFDDDGL
ncbi:hypothetical protein [Vreelandella jeotgali]|uniref:hypothetical protein n=1 Tax=Vreelandella jeotgali TaxID=553386 RepID=UPI00036C0360|nr:hypothetical protein [Halomonas jeotgali]